MYKDCEIRCSVSFLILDSVKDFVKSNMCGSDVTQSKLVTRALAERSVACQNACKNKSFVKINR